MTWIKDGNDSLVNINNWDVLDYITITDTSTNLTVAYKIYLERKGEERVLGYVSSKSDLGEDIIDRISKGVSESLSSFGDILYYYLDDEFDEKFGDMNSGKGFESNYEIRMKEIKKLIGKRFKEDE